MSERYPRRAFIATGTAAGAAVVWGAAHPFADSDIGQTAQAADGASGATGTATPTPTPTAIATATAVTTATPTPTATATGGTGSAKRDHLHVKSGHTVHASKHHVATVKVSVTGPNAVNGTVRLQAVSHGKLIGVGTAHFHIGKGGGQRTVKVHLNKAGRTLLAKHGHLPGRVLVSAHGVTSALRHVTIKG